MKRWKKLILIISGGGESGKLGKEENENLKDGRTSSLLPELPTTVKIKEHSKITR